MKKQGSLLKAACWFALGLVVGVIGTLFFKPSPVEASTLPRVTICHQPGRNQQTMRVRVPAIPGHMGHGDYLGACRHLPPPPVCNWVQETRCTVQCGGGTAEWYYRGRGCSNAMELRRCNTQACPTPTPVPSTTRMCHWNGTDFDAIAVASVARQRHFNAHQLDKDWSEGMDAKCLFPVTPAPQPVVRGTSPAGFTPACYGVTHPVIPWASAERNGTSAIIRYVPTTGEGDSVNVVFAENPFDIIFNLGNHGLRDWTPNNGHVQLNDLVAGQSYWFRIANGCSRWSGIFFIPAN